MNKLIKAVFTDEVQAEYTENCIHAYYPDAKTDLTVINSIGGYYNDTAVLPNLYQYSGITSQFFTPVFPLENRSESVKKTQKAVLEIKCSPDKSGEVERLILDNGGAIRD